MTSFEIDAKTQIVGLFGFPVEHSLSPIMHNAAFQATGLNWRYHAFSVPPHDLKAALLGMKALGLRGVNATIPHKEALLSLVDEVSPRARSLGAINTVHVRENGQLFGENTDAPGFVADLKKHDVDPANHKALVLGAGGSARAIVYGLLEGGCPHVHVANRTLGRGETLARDMNAALPGDRVSFGGLIEGPESLDSFSLAVNTSSVGLKDRRSIWPEAWSKEAIQVAYDLIYSPPETAFLESFQRMGALTINGLGMLAEQGRLAWTLWTGRDLQAELMVAALKKAIRPSPETS
ncbi:MAG: shikimate dehydrogenase [Planctomycetota bacterium]|nr:shikimate dehydrogenase [Planctomycetota bacterium]